MSKRKHIPVGRRSFLKRAAAGAAAATVLRPRKLSKRNRGAPVHSAAQVAHEKVEAPQRIEALTTGRPGSDFMVDVIKSLGFEYICANPGSSFRCLHESLINYGATPSLNSSPAFHEESSGSMAHGYAKIEGKPVLVLAHGTVGQQHASIAIYNAYCARVRGTRQHRQCKFPSRIG